MKKKTLHRSKSTNDIFKKHKDNIFVPEQHEDINVDFDHLYDEAVKQFFEKTKKDNREIYINTSDELVKDGLKKQFSEQFANDKNNSGKVDSLTTLLEQANMVEQRLDAVINNMRNGEYNNYQYQDKYFTKEDKEYFTIFQIKQIAKNILAEKYKTKNFYSISISDVMGRNTYLIPITQHGRDFLDELSEQLTKERLHNSQNTLNKKTRPTSSYGGIERRYNNELPDLNIRNYTRFNQLNNIETQEQKNNELKKQKLLSQLKKNYSKILTQPQITKIAETALKYNQQQPLQAAKELICNQLISRYTNVLSAEKIDEIINEQNKDPIKIKDMLFEAMQIQEKKCEAERTRIIQSPRLSEEDEELLKNASEETKTQFLIQKLKEHREQTKLPDTKFDDENRCHKHLFVEDYCNFANQQDRTNEENKCTILENDNDNIDVDEEVKYLRKHYKGFTTKEIEEIVEKNIKNTLKMINFKEIFDKKQQIRKNLIALNTNFYDHFRDMYSTRRRIRKNNKKIKFNKINQKKSKNI